MNSFQKAIAVFVLLSLVLFSLIALRGCNKESNKDVKSVPSEMQTSSVASSEPEVPVSLWDSAKYTEDTILGSGSKKISVKVTAEEKTVTFTILTDAGTLADALTAQELISGENGEFGIYIKTVNGILADYNVNKAYWSIYKSGEALMTGADRTPITTEDEFEFIYAQE